MRDGQLAVCAGGGDGGRLDVDLLQLNVAFSGEVAEGGTGECVLLEEDYGLSVGDPGFDAAVVSDCDGFAGNNVEELVSRGVAVVFADVELEVVGVDAFVVEDCDHLGLALATLGECDGVRLNVHCGGFGGKVAGVVAGDVATEEVEFCDEHVEDCGFIVFVFPERGTVGVGLSAAVEVLLLAIVDDRDTVVGEQVCNHVLRGRHVLGVVGEADNVMVLLRC